VQAPVIEFQKQHELHSGRQLVKVLEHDLPCQFLPALEQAPMLVSQVLQLAAELHFAQSSVKVVAHLASPRDRELVAEVSVAAKLAPG
jgi:NADH:ubiquinone oxidoreductase subunit C